jgi:hypothetical protein
MLSDATSPGIPWRPLASSGITWHSLTSLNKEDMTFFYLLVKSSSKLKKTMLKNMEKEIYISIYY